MSTVRSWEWRDRDAIVRHANNRNVWMNLRDRFPYPYTDRDARNWLECIVGHEPETNFAIAVAGEAVGGIGFILQHDVARRSAEIGYWLGEEFWGRGIATEAVIAVTYHAFANHDLCRVYAHVFDWNRPSARVLEKAGYEFEGRMRKSVTKDGKTIDQLMYGGAPGAPPLQRRHMKIFIACLVVLCSVLCASAQEIVPDNTLTEKRVPLAEAAVALDASGAPALEATLRTTALNGSPDTPVTNIRMIVKNKSTLAYAFVSGSVTFYDAAGVRCGEGVFKADALAVDESFETDSPGVRIRCEVTTWRIVATNLLPRLPPNAPITTLSRAPQNLIISIDGETHPIQLDRPLTLTLGEKRRTIVVRTAK